MKYKTNFEGIIYKKVKGTYEELKNKYEITDYDHSNQEATILTWFKLPDTIDVFLNEAEEQDSFWLRINHHKMISFNSIDEMLAYMNSDKNKYSWSIPDEHLIIRVRSVNYKEEPDILVCETCNAKKCDICYIEQFSVFNKATDETDYIDFNRAKARDYFNMNIFKEEAIRAIEEICCEFNVENTADYLNFDSFSPKEQFLRLCRNTGAIGSVTRYI